MKTYEARLAALGLAVALLWQVAVDHDDAAQERALMAVADPLIAQVLALPAHDMAGLRLKAEAVAWCCASRRDFGLGDSLSERLIGSLLGDLLAGARLEV